MPQPMGLDQPEPGFFKARVQLFAYMVVAAATDTVEGCLFAAGSTAQFKMSMGFKSRGFVLPSKIGSK